MFAIKLFLPTSINVGHNQVGISATVVEKVKAGVIISDPFLN